MWALSGLPACAGLWVLCQLLRQTQIWGSQHQEAVLCVSSYNVVSALPLPSQGCQSLEPPALAPLLPSQSSGIGILVESFLSSPRPPVPYPGDVLLPSPDTGNVTK